MIFFAKKGEGCMFLNSMSNEEKTLFLELAYKLANIDGDYAEEEEEIINSYKAELGIFDIGDTGSIDDIIDFFATRNETVKKIVLFELYGMICADNQIVDAEKVFFEKLRNKFQIPEYLVDRIIEVADELQEVYDKVYEILA